MSLIDAYRQTYRGLGLDVWKLAAITFVHRSGTMVLPFLALYATEELGTSAVRAGTVLALYGLGAGGLFALDRGGRLLDPRSPGA